MQKIILLLTLIFLFGCSEDTVTDQALIEKDRKALEEQLNSEKVMIYKFCKIMIRASAVQDSTSSQYKSITPEMKSAIKHFDKLNQNKPLTALEYLMLYKDYALLREFTEKTNEDDYPTLSEAMAHSHSTKKKKVFLSGKEKQEKEAAEHALLSIMVQFGGGFGKDVALYECSKTNPDLLADSEEKSLLLFYRGYLFFGNGLYYLSEDEITQNIDWLNANPKVDLQWTRFFFGWTNISDTRAYDGYLSMNYLFRGFDRMMMDRAIDDERSLEDFEKFLELSNKMGISSEVTLSIETYIHLKKGENDQAIVSLTKLKKSPNLSDAQKEMIDESIGYLNNKETGKVLNGVYDKAFITKIASQVVMNQVTSLNWQQYLTKQKIPYAKKIGGIVGTYRHVAHKIEQYTSGKSIEATGETLWDKAKNLVE